MKNLSSILMIALTLVFASSCSSNDDNNNDGNGSAETATVTIDGTAKTYNVFIVQESTVDFGTPENPALIVSLSNTSDTSEILSFTVTKDEVGSNIFDRVVLTSGQNAYAFSTEDSVICATCPVDPAIMTSLVQTNANSTLKGSFSGTLSSFDGTTYQTKVLTNGTFDFTF